MDVFNQIFKSRNAETNTGNPRFLHPPLTLIFLHLKVKGGYYLADMFQNQMTIFELEKVLKNSYFIFLILEHTS
jgi:hypothetical protein